MPVIVYLLTLAINIVTFVIFLQVVIHWLILFDVFRVKTPQARDLVDTLNRFSEKLYGPVRKFIPPIGGIDITPVVVIIGLQILSTVIRAVLLPGHVIIL